jgi:hypothetical protein
MWFQFDLSESDTKGQNCGIKVGKVGYHEKIKFRTSRFMSIIVLHTVKWEHDVSVSELQWLNIGMFAVLSILIMFSYS